MIQEFARLSVKTGQSAEFEAAFLQASEIIKQMAGFISLNLYRHHDQPDVYLLSVLWSDIDAHSIGFRQSPEYQQ